MGNTIAEKDKLNKSDLVKSSVIILATYLVSVAIVSAYALLLKVPPEYKKTGFTFAAIGILSLGLFFYLYFLDKNLLRKRKQLGLTMAALLVCFVICLALGEVLHLYIRPFALAALLVATLTNRSIGLYVNVMLCTLFLIVDYYVYPTELFVQAALTDVLMGLVCGILFLFMSMTTKRRINVITMGFRLCPITAATAVVVEALTKELGMNLLIAAGWGVAVSFLTVILFLSMLPLFESLFNMVTDYRLMELSDHSNKLLVRLSSEAPGTFNHSIVVGNLAERCALAIGENTNLARASAYYHDVGKLINPLYFKENQKDGANPHDDIMPEVSVSIIKNHTADGAALGKEYHLPKEIIDVMLQHHGTLPIRVFYVKAKKYTDGEINLEDFCYDGPKPTGKIAAIIMIADAAEAAVRVLSERSGERVTKVVGDIIDERMKLGQFVNCDITLRDLEIVKRTIVNTLSGVYHERIQYPTIEIKDNGSIEIPTESK